MSELITPEEAAKFFKIGSRALRSWIKSDPAFGNLWFALSHNGKLRAWKDTVERFAREMSNKGNKQQRL